MYALYNIIMSTILMYNWCVMCTLTAGTGIYVDTSQGTGTGLTTGAQPDNSYAIVDIGDGYHNIRFSMYCCSNSSSSQGTVIFPNGVTRYRNSYDDGYVIRYTGSSDMYGGCVRFYFSASYYYYSFYLSYPGIYTCSFGDNQINNIGLYSEGSSSELYLIFLI